MSAGYMKNRRVLITGATSGIGEITAYRLAEMGAEVLVVSRNENKTRSVAENIMAKGQKAYPFVADLSSKADIHRLSEEIHSKFDSLDVLLNNAGAIFMKRIETVDGLEMTFALNHLNYFMLTSLLLDLLKNGSKPRIVNVSSGAHFGGRINFSDLQIKEKYSGWRAYSASKLMNILFTYELDRRLKKENSFITVNALHPGFVATNFGKSNGGLLQPIFGITQLAAIKPEEGAKTSIYLASSPDVENISGKYFANCAETRSSPGSYDNQAALKLWQASELLAN